MLSAEGVSYRVNGRLLLEDVSAAFAPGELSLVIGPNGAGKSTLVKALSRQIKAASGTVCYDGRPLADWTDLELARVRAVLSQNVDIAFPLKAREVVMMGRYPHFTGAPERNDEAAAEGAMRYFDVRDLADREYLTLSGGEQQRVQFARVLAQIWDSPAAAGTCRYLILDEPLTFLDIRYQFDFMRRIRELLGGGDLVVVGVVHDLNLAARFADRLLLLSRGRVLASGDTEAVLEPELIHEAFAIQPVLRRDEATGRPHLIFH